MPICDNYQTDAYDTNPAYLAQLPIEQARAEMDMIAMEMRARPPRPHLRHCGGAVTRSLRLPLPPAANQRTTPISDPRPADHHCMFLRMNATSMKSLQCSSTRSIPGGNILDQIHHCSSDSRSAPYHPHRVH